MQKNHKIYIKHTLIRISPLALGILIIIFLTIISSETDLINMESAYLLSYLILVFLAINFIYIISETIYFYIKKKKTLFRLNFYILISIIVLSQIFS